MRSRCFSALSLCLLLLPACGRPQPTLNTPPATTPIRSPAVPTAPEAPFGPTASSSIQTGSAPDLAEVLWLKGNALPVQSIQPSEMDFSDLQGLKQIIGSKRIVMLGEETHGDGSTFLAKVRLVEFLHEQMGFDVLAFESGFYDCHKAWEGIRAGGSTASAFHQSVFPIWSQSSQIQPLIQYLDRTSKTGRPLILAGFDSQFTGMISHADFVNDLATFLAKYPGIMPAGPAWTDWAEQTQHLVDGYFTSPSGGLSPDEADLDQYLNEIQILETGIQMAPGPADRKTAFWLQMLQDLAAQATLVWKTSVVGSENLGAHPEIATLRDIQMGRNLIWLAHKYYPDQKIIVWAATYHIARNLSTTMSANPVVQADHEQITTMGDVVWREMGNQVYALGFTAYSGSSRTVFGGPVNILLPPSPGSLEDLMARAGLENALLDFRHLPEQGAWLHDPIISRPLGYDEVTANWTDVLDGMFFIRQMAPSLPSSP